MYNSVSRYKQKNLAVKQGFTSFLALLHILFISRVSKPRYKMQSQYDADLMSEAFSFIL